MFSRSWALMRGIRDEVLSPAAPLFLLLSALADCLVLCDIVIDHIWVATVESSSKTSIARCFVLEKLSGRAAASVCLLQVPRSTCVGTGIHISK